MTWFMQIFQIYQEKRLLVENYEIKYSKALKIQKITIL